MYELPQLMSPLILIAGLLGCFLVPSPRISKTSKSAKINLAMLLALMLVGWVGLMQRFNIDVWLSETYNLAANIFVYAAATLICARIAQTWGLHWLLFACFIIFWYLVSVRFSRSYL